MPDLRIFAILTLDDLPPWFLRIFALALGLVWGSFLNVVIYRVPRNLSVVRPGSCCPNCKTPIRPWDNVPVLGYLFLRGKARCCGTKLSPRYPLVEAIGGLLSLAVLEAVVFRLAPTTPMGRVLAIYTADFALALALVAAAFIDLEHMILPDSITLGGAALGFATCSFRHLTFTQSALGGVVGFVVVWLPFVVLYAKLRGRPGMGLGDAKLLLLAGTWFGWGGALFVLGAGAMQGTVAALVTWLVRGRIDEPEAVRLEREELKAELAQMTAEDREKVEKELAGDPLVDEPEEGLGQARMAFGPFLILATLECLLFGRDVFGAYLNWLDAA